MCNDINENKRPYGNVISNACKTSLDESIAGAIMQKKKQHFIPSSYLMSWVCRNIPDHHNPYVWIFSYDGKIARKKAPENIFYHNDYYTLYGDDGERILAIEDGFAGLESRFVKIRSSKLEKRLPLSMQERQELLLFIATMYSRTPASRERTEEAYLDFFNQVKKIRADFIKNYNPITQKELYLGLGTGNTVTIEEMENTLNEPITSLMLPKIRTIYSTISKLNLSIIVVDDAVGFITSDSPCYLNDPEAYKRPAIYRAARLGYQSAELILPISPNLLCHIGHYSLPFYMDGNKELIDNVNRLTRFNAYEHFIVNDEYCNEFWFKHINPPY